MRQLLTIFVLLTSISAFGQTAQESLDAGILKQKNQDYKGALKDYSKAIKADKELTNAYYNRATVKLATDDLKGAMSDFDKTINLDDKMTDAYYGRATVYIGQQQYKESMPDLNKVIEMDDTFPNALTLRAQIHFALNNNDEGCKDLNRAKEIGDPAADSYLAKFCGEELPKGETINFNWPEDENWEMQDLQENEQMTMLELLRDGETSDNWTEIGTMQSIKGATNIGLDKAMKIMYEQSLIACPKAKLTFIEKDESAEFPWIMFTVECGNNKTTNGAESQLWYIVQGKTALYINFRAIKSDVIPEETKNKWTLFFKSGEIEYDEQ